MGVDSKDNKDEELGIKALCLDMLATKQKSLCCPIHYSQNFKIDGGG